MKIHEVVDHPALQVVLDCIDDDLFANVDQLHIRHVLLILVNRLVHLFVIADPVAKVLRSHIGILTLVVWRGGLDLEDVRHDQRLVVTFRLDVNGPDIVAFALLMNPTPSSFAGVGGI